MFHHGRGPERAASLMADAKIVVTLDNTAKLAENIQKLSEFRVLVGIPEDKDPRPAPDTIGNAALGYIHEHGSPIRNIPPRPWLVPGVLASRDAWQKQMERAGEAATGLMWDPGAVEKALMAAGQAAVNGVRNRIRAGIPPPLKPATIAARRRRSKGSKYRRKAKSASDTTPLYDTGNLVKAITSVVEKGKLP